VQKVSNYESKLQKFHDVDVAHTLLFFISDLLFLYTRKTLYILS